MLSCWWCGNGDGAGDNGSGNCDIGGILIQNERKIFWVQDHDGSSDSDGDYIDAGVREHDKYVANLDMQKTIWVSGMFAPAVFVKSFDERVTHIHVNICVYFVDACQMCFFLSIACRRSQVTFARIGVALVTVACVYSACVRACSVRGRARVCSVLYSSIVIVCVFVFVCTVSMHCM